MPDYRFLFERGEHCRQQLSLDLPDVWAIAPVAKRVALAFAASEIRCGHLDMAQELTVRDAENAVIARFPLADFLKVDGRAELCEPA